MRRLPNPSWYSSRSRSRGLEHRQQYPLLPCLTTMCRARRPLRRHWVPNKWRRRKNCASTRRARSPTTTFRRLSTTCRKHYTCCRLAWPSDLFRFPQCCVHYPLQDALSWARRIRFSHCTRWRTSWWLVFRWIHSSVIVLRFSIIPRITHLIHFYLIAHARNLDWDGWKIE